MKILNLFPGSVGSNCYLAEEGGEALIIDPSASASAILRKLSEEGCTPVGILLTHGHFDHIMSVDTLRQAVPGLKVFIHESDAPMLTDADKNAFALFFGQDRVWKPADVLLGDGDEIKVVYIYNADKSQMTFMGKFYSNPALKDSDGDGADDPDDRAPLNSYVQ